MTGEEETAAGPAAGARPPAAGGDAPGAITAAGGAEARSRSFWREIPVLVVAALVIALVIKTFVIQAFYIPSGSMQNTLEIGDKVLVSKLVYHFRSIQPGDIIVFDGAGSWEAPAATATSSDPVARLYDVTLRPLFRSVGGLFGTAPGQTDFIKRVIGVPGDHVACCNARGLVTVNGVALHESSYLYPGNVPGEAPAGESGRFSLNVPAGRLWVLGDHRAISDDSRGHVADPGDGTIPESEVIGRAFLIVWPPGRWRVLSLPATFLQPGIAGGPAAQPAPLRPGSGGPGSAGPGFAVGSQAVLAGAPGGRLAAEPPFLPLGAGLAGAVPLTFLQRRVRVRVRWRRRGSRAARRAGG